MPEDGGLGTDEGARDDVAGRLDAIVSEFEGNIEDLRERVVQLKRELDGKAPVDHDHPDLADRLESGASADAVDDLDERVENLEADLAAHEERLDDAAPAGAVSEIEGSVADHDERLANLAEKVDVLASSVVDVQDRVDDLGPLEESVEEQSATVEDLGEKVEVLASSLLDVQDRLAELDRRETERADLARLLAAANRAGVRRAACGACGDRVEAGLLREPNCPHCGERFVDVEGRGFGRAGVLRTGEPPERDADAEAAGDPGDLAGGAEGAGAGGDGRTNRGTGSSDGDDA